VAAKCVQSTDAWSDQRTAGRRWLGSDAIAQAVAPSLTALTVGRLRPPADRGRTWPTLLPLDTNSPATRQRLEYGSGRSGRPSIRRPAWANPRPPAADVGEGAVATALDLGWGLWKADGVYAPLSMELSPRPPARRPRLRTRV